MLPPWVIVHGARKSKEGGRLFLGPSGWTPQREGALSFHDEVGAREWIASARTQTPALYAGHEPQPLKVDHTAKVDVNGAPYTLADYEPI